MSLRFDEGELVASHVRSSRRSNASGARASTNERQELRKATDLVVVFGEMERPPPARPVRFERLRVSGYRAFREPLELRDLQEIVVLYGINNAGKTNLLKAVDLVARLVGQQLPKLLDETAENATVLYERLQEDPWMFAQGAGGRVELDATLQPGDQELGFEIVLEGTTARARLVTWREGSDDWLAIAVKARKAMQSAQQAPAASEDTASEETKAFEDCKSRWLRLRETIRVSPARHAIPITRDLRKTVAAFAKATDVSQRKRATRMRAMFGGAALGLPPGALEEVDVAAADPDFGWVTDEGIVPLDLLGSGAQAVFGMLASITVVDAPILLIDEPESHLNVLQQDAVLNALLEARKEFGIQQLIMASHSVKFARPSLDIRILERSPQGVKVRSIKPPMLREFEARTPPPERPQDVSMLAFDNTVELPQFVRDDLGIAPGQYVYFVKRDGGYRVLSEAAMDDALKLDR